MEETIEVYIDFLRDVRHMSKNTYISYKRDLEKFGKYFISQGVYAVNKINQTNINSYILWLEKNGHSSSTIARHIASMKSFFRYLLNEGKISSDPTMFVHGPVIEKKNPKIIEMEKVDKLLSQPDPDTDKGVRDKAMLELMYATGLKVTELISIIVDDVNTASNYFILKENNKERFVSYDDRVGFYVNKYINGARNRLIKGDEKFLFVNCSGKPMSRQGFWKLIKKYAKDAGLDEDITPYSLRHSFAKALVKKGEDEKNIQKKLGYISLSSVNRYKNS